MNSGASSWRVWRILVSGCSLLALPAVLFAADRPTGIVQRVAGGAPAGSSQVVVTGDVPLVHTAQFLSTDEQGRLVGGADVVAQTRAALGQLERALAAVGSSLDEVAKLNVYVARDDAATEVARVVAERFAKQPPAICWVTTRLPLAEAVVAFDAVAAAPADRAVESVQLQRVAGLPGREQQPQVGVLPRGSRIYVAGQAEKGDLREATRRTLESLRATLKFLGRTDADIVQLKSFVTPMARVAEAEEEFRKFFGNHPTPPLVFVEWESSLPIEIELVAYGGPSPAGQAERDPVEYLTPPGMTTPTIYSRVARVHGPRTIFVSGLYGASGGDGAKQVTDVFSQLEGALRETGSDLRHLAKATYYVSDNDASQKLNELRPKYYDPRRPPAASKANVKGVARPATTITVDMIAVPTPKTGAARSP